MTEIKIVDGEPKAVVKAHGLPSHRATVANYADGQVVAFGPVGERYRPMENEQVTQLGQAVVDGGDGSLLALGAFGNPVGSGLDGL